MTTIEEDAEKHAKWYSEHMSYMLYHTYKDAFIHGYKHGVEDENSSKE